jgi:hypothetical protein
MSRTLILTFYFCISLAALAAFAAARKNTSEQACPSGARQVSGGALLGSANLSAWVSFPPRGRPVSSAIFLKMQINYIEAAWLS